MILRMAASCGWTVEAKSVKVSERRGRRGLRAGF